ncbi:MAG: glycerol-3-phosphate ABC transporter ATP-binding protein [Elusimicrobia bacterium GWA2_69_24]|nr:MAG: glycerol-3-phosphate ABC transporter ATP-binding protein [Elusimicrobia bacterium GWA2_69_24]HBL16691.1 glycerol-3-phosphate ABC transporter ATP-binding protein [Elusimicrobiota bacterium]
MASVTLRNIVKDFNDNRVLDNVTLGIADREFLVLVGPSGCGKSTLLRILAGLEDATGGETFIDGTLVNHLPPRSREIAMVFQDYALYPHMTVAENMSFGLRLRRMPKPEIEARVREAAGILQIEKLLERTPKQLSGGQRQRVAIGRAIVRKPKVFLFDEPLSNLDAKLREEMRVEIAKLHQRLHSTIVYVTHDQVEAMTLASRIAVIQGGTLQQVGTPEQVFSRPENVFVAGFIGSPTMNFVAGTLSPEGTGLCFANDAMKVALPAGLLETPPAAPLPVILGVRPESLRPAGDGPAGRQGIPAEVDVVELLGHRKNVHLLAGGTKLLMVVDAAFSPRAGESLQVSFDAAALHFFDRTTTKRLR